MKNDDGRVQAIFFSETESELLSMTKRYRLHKYFTTTTSHLPHKMAFFQND